MSNVDINVDRRTDGQKIGRLYRTLLQAGAIKMYIHVHKFRTIAFFEQVGVLKGIFSGPYQLTFFLIKLYKSYLFSIKNYCCFSFLHNTYLGGILELL